MNIESGFMLSDVGRSVSHDRVLCLLTQTLRCEKFIKLDVKLQVFFTSALLWGERPASRTGRFILVKTSQYPLECWMGFRVLLDALEKKFRPGTGQEDTDGE